jgi:hypothetical protein
LTGVPANIPEYRDHGLEATCHVVAGNIMQAHLTKFGEICFIFD